MHNLALAASEWVTIGLHPTEVPVGVVASSTAPLEACAATLAGSLSSAYWPGGTFRTCLPFDGSRRRTVVTFTPSSSTIAAQAYSVPGYGPVAGCFVGVRPNREVAVRVSGNPPRGETVALYVDWGP